MRLEDVDSITQTDGGVAYVKLDDAEGTPVDHGLGMQTNRLQTNRLQTNRLQTNRPIDRDRAFSVTLKDANQFLNILANDRANLQGMPALSGLIKM
jgi:hypothetical protein